MDWPLRRMDFETGESPLESNEQELSKRIRSFFSDGIQIIDNRIEPSFEYTIPDSYMRVDIMFSKGDRRVFVDLNPTITHNNATPFPSSINNGGPCPRDLSMGNPRATTRYGSYNHAKKMMALFPSYDYIQVWDWDDINTMMYRVVEKLTGATRVYSARELGIERVPQSSVNMLLAKWHPQGPTSGQTACYVLSDMATSEPVMVATFGGSRFNQSYEWEWIRTAVAPGVRIHGGQKRVFRAFVDDNNPESVMSYIDFSKTTTAHTFLNHCGFIEGYLTGPALIWSRGSKKVNETTLLRIGGEPCAWN